MKMKCLTCQMCGKTVLPIGTARKNGVKFDDDWKDRKSFLEKNEAGRSRE